MIIHLLKELPVCMSIAYLLYMVECSATSVMEVFYNSIHNYIVKEGNILNSQLCRT